MAGLANFRPYTQQAVEAGFEPPRVLRRLQHLREWSHEKSNKFSPEVR
ncbi:hypothetical protein SAMN05720354_10614 [Nitrosospira sp. Nsp1]|nr:hypothetical protein SAMN05720354_10614 [Nitrosospira sp. Nsp1]